MEQVEIHRINTIKQAFTEYTSCLSTSLPIDKSMIEELVANQESLKPDQDIQYIVQQYYVSGFSPKPILYENFYHGIAHGKKTTSLGPSLMYTHSCPFIIHNRSNLWCSSYRAGTTWDRACTYLHQATTGCHCTRYWMNDARGFGSLKWYWLYLYAIGSKELESERKKTLWSTRVPLDKVHSLRTDINISTDRVTMDLLLQHDPGLLVALLRLYLLELPQCLFTFELYDAAHALYSNSKWEGGGGSQVIVLHYLLTHLVINRWPWH